jgi:NTP pyrophosphatase (non-canonical NTP hydrolase)
MTLYELCDAIARRNLEWDPFNVLTPTFCATELAGELGEACNVVKKLEREHLGLPGSRDTVEHLAEELADVIICVGLLANAYHIDLESVVPRKFNASSLKLGLSVFIGDPK